MPLGLCDIPCIVAAWAREHERLRFAIAVFSRAHERGGKMVDGGIVFGQDLESVFAVVGI